MKYETVGGAIHDTNYGKMFLRDLKIGDRFTNKHGKGLYEVFDETCKFNIQAGTPTRRCKNLKDGSIEYKQCRIEVIKRS